LALKEATSSVAARDMGGSAALNQRRVASIDALRGLIMFTMIFVNDLAGAPDKVVPGWMKHFHGRSGMTFVDLVFPAFLFIAGMSIPFGLGNRLRRGDSLWEVACHVAVRTASLLFVGILMVNEVPDTTRLGWSGSLWSTLMFFCAILSFSSISRPSGRQNPSFERRWRVLSLGLRITGFLSLVVLAFLFRRKDGHKIISLAPFSIHTEWYGILGLIGWAYLVAAAAFLSFRQNLTALLGCAVILMCLYPAEHTGAFRNFWLAHYVGIGGMLGSQAAISVAGLLLGCKVAQGGARDVSGTLRFTLSFAASCAAGAWLLQGLYGINKNQATPSWCLWACAITAVLWLLLFGLADVWRFETLTHPLVLAGENVFLAYLLSEMLPSLLDWLNLGDWYGRLATASLTHAISRSAACAILVLSASTLLNRLGFRLKL
jgi:predicted acyltransferase